MIKWQWKLFKELSVDDLYAILKVRQEVFAIEQDCIYQDMDDLDKFAWHLIGTTKSSHKSPEVVAYLRVVFPNHNYKEPSIGRLLTVKSVRGTGLGKELLRQALYKMSSDYPKQAIRISAQQHLIKFYYNFGFTQVSEPYDEDGIAHIEMLRL
jgi:ElaA protein